MKQAGHFNRAVIVMAACLMSGGVAFASEQAPASHQGIALTLLKKSTYHHGWIDLNKNGKEDVYENPSEPVNKRVDDLLSRMNMKGKTMQLVTLYGYGRMLKDVIPKHVAYCR